jgi:hypothetical protein
MDSTDLVQDRHYERDVVNAVVKFGVPQDAGRLFWLRYN